MTNKRRNGKHQSFDDDDTAEQSRGPQGMLHLMENLVPKYDGQDQTYPVHRWIQYIEDNGDIFEWSPTQRLLVARRSLTGTAALWLRSEKTHKTWDELKQAIGREFPDTVDIKTVHELMSTRIKKQNPYMGAQRIICGLRKCNYKSSEECVAQYKSGDLLLSFTQEKGKKGKS
ncbi:putative blastopia polyprotein [Operophtera brumata]|uniref:Putative blastopia polyprotein n=1 Tax=Operophtera brumata TaxID=104452 RepID=A0A0L7KYM7_OPEBR|nr:putative blastopia polyprotein [Operophtera brumata]